MKIATFRVNKRFCGDCSIALKRFIEGIDGVDAVDLGNSSMAIRFRESVIDDGKLRSIARNSIERLGYCIEE